MTEDSAGRRRLLALLAATPLVGGAAVARSAPTEARAGGREVNVRDFGAVGDGVTDDRPAFLAAIASVHENAWSINGRPAYAGGPRIRVPAGSYYLSDSIDLKRTVILEGDSGGMAGGQATSMIFPPNRHGIIIDRWNTIGGTRTEARPTGGADGTIIQNLAIVSKGGNQGHGILAKARFTARELLITGFAGNGYHVAATSGAGGAAEGNANSFQILGGRVEKCGGNGVHVVGADANAGLIQAVDSSHNAGWGFHDKSFLGNTYVACHAADNGAGAYFSGDPNARNVYVGCYSESGQPPSQINSPAFVISGLHGAGIAGSATVISGVSGALLSRGGFRSENGSMTAHFGSDPENGDIFSITDTEAAPLSWRLRRTDKDLRFDYANLDSMVAYTITGPGTKLRFGRNSGVPHVFAAPWLGLGFGQEARLMTCGKGPPAGGFHAQGERIFHSSPSPGGHEGWVCVAAGSPGTWRKFGSIEG